jgi:hypothetical protein
MKTTILLLFVALASCSKPDNVKQDPVFQLPPETQTGANTFGVTIKGKVYIPRDPTGVSVGTTPKGMIFWGTSDNSWNELEVKDGASSVGFNIKIHIRNLETIGVSKYFLQKSNFHNGIDSTPFTHIYFKIWDSAISNYAYYGSVENQGEVNITRNSNDITSGNFKGKFVRQDNQNDFIEITDGRFDIGPGLYNKPFP